MISPSISKTRAALQLAGMPEELDYAAKKVWVPSLVELEGEVLVWSEAKGKTFYRLEKVDRSLLLKFIALGDSNAAAEEILKFAGKWGVLDLCKHGFPGGSHLTPAARARGDRVSRCSPVRFEGRVPLKHWRRIAREFGALLRIAAELHEGHMGRKDDWTVVRTNRGQPADGWLHDVESQRVYLARIVNDLHRKAFVQVTLSWDGRDPELSYGGASLVGALVVQLTLIVARAHGLFFCKACGNPAWRSGRRSAKPFKYCGRCGVKAAWRINKAHRRRLAAEVHRLKLDEGLSEEMIAIRIYADARHPVSDIREDLSKPGKSRYRQKIRRLLKEGTGR